ncbi:hypothetical protein TrLO_g11512 [Triparma laevis f. longispina]|uniref:Uncharacterized protein n=1 Tax=Triparma laevis f. longispina TaxID=1714387 RepID=A0A9W7CDP0_9STRA|nr:hypothetical protein TrLO_g11512 [Triparma laevis f. longispina]
MSTPPPTAPAPMNPKELAAKFFGFQAESFCNTVFQSVDDYIADGMDAMEVAMCPSFPNPAHRASLKTCNDSFIDTLTQGYDRNLDKFEIYVKRNVFSIPEEGIDGVVKEFERGASTPSKKRAKKSEGEDVSDAKKEVMETSIPTSAAAIPSKAETLALDNELAELRSKLRTTKRSVQTLKVASKKLSSTLSNAESSHTKIADAISSSESHIGAPLHDTVSAVVMGKDGLEQLKKEGNMLMKRLGNEENEDFNVEKEEMGLVKSGTAKEVGDLKGILGGN